jgi:hypothetical protein
VRHLAGIEQLYALCANAGIGRTPAGQTRARGPATQIQAD